MKRLALLITVVLVSSPVLMAAEGDQPPQQRIQQQIQRIRQAKIELDEQRNELQQQQREWERQRDPMQPQRQQPNRERQALGRQQSPMQTQMQWAPRQKMNKDGRKPICALLMVMCLVVHILVAVWVFQDIRMRGAGSGIWIVIALIAGLLGALVYAVVRLGDIKKS